MVRSAFKTVRLIKKFNSFKGYNLEKMKDPSFFLALETGSFTNFAGCGSMYQNFLQTETLGNYSGQNQDPKMPTDTNFSKSKLRILPFDHTFTFLPIDMNECKQ